MTDLAEKLLISTVGREDFMAGLPDFFKGREIKPAHGVSRLQRQLERLIDDFFTPSGHEGRLHSGMHMPSTEVEETDTHIVMTFDLPGLKKEDIKIEIVDNQLRIFGERKEEEKKKGKGLYHSERFYGLFERTFSLPAHVKSDEITAEYEDGVLKLTVPKSQTAKIQQVKIRGGEKKAA
jgi:HSP20 family protein